jgi:protein involved in polysaccharide export with SLBB domain
LLDEVQPDSILRVFGRSLFENVTTQFQPMSFGPVDPGYLLGPGDQVQLFITGEIELAYNLDVTREGFVVIPDVGQISVNGLTLDDFRGVLYMRLASVYSGVQPGPEATTRFHVSLGRLRTNQVFLIGEVSLPGAYQMSPASTVFNALYSANGPSVEGSMRSIQVRRGGEITGELDVYDYLIKGDASEDFRLEQGDFIFVPLVGPQVSIEGDVRRPAIYEIKDGEGLTELLEFSGGLSATAFSGKVQIDRILPVDQRLPGRERILVDVDLGSLDSDQRIVLYDGDRVFIESVLEERVARVSLEGQVQRPGNYQLTQGMTIQDLIVRSGGLRRDAFGNIVHLERMQLEDSTYTLTQIQADADGRMNPNLLLQDFDRVRVFANTTLTSEASVYIGGEIKEPSTYDFRIGMTVSDLILLGEGFTANADPMSVEVIRRNDDMELSDRVSEVLNVYVPNGQIPTEIEFETLDQERQDGTSHLASEVLLKPNDRVFVRRLQNRRYSQDIIVAGEILRPGAYSRLT